MVVGRHSDGRIYLIAKENGVPPMIKQNGIWAKKELDSGEIMEFTPIRDSETLLNLLAEAEKSLDIIQSECICPAACDCANPEPQSGVAHISNACPEHNLYPEPVDECPAEKHKGGQRWADH